MDKKQKEILEFIKVLRQSFTDASTIYTWWACYGFYEIMKHLHKDCIAYLCNWEHVACKIWEKYYDIDWFINEKDNELKEMDYLDHYKAESWKDWQRVENMIRKYINQ